MITDIEDYFTKGCGRCDRFDTPACSTQIWSSALLRLRNLCLSAGLSEHVKWGHPCYMHAGRNLAIIGAFRDNIRLTFFQRGLMKDPEGVLERQGPNSATPDVIRITDAVQLDVLEPVILAYLEEAKGYADAGLKAPKVQTDTPVPDELTDALDADPELADAFAALTPGRRKGYLLHIGGAKQSATRTARIEKLRPRIFAGKGYNER